MNIAPDQPEVLSKDVFPGQMLAGSLQRISPKVAATVTFTELVQRVVVRMIIGPRQDLAQHPEPEMSVVASIQSAGER